MELRTIYFNGVLFEKRDREKERERKDAYNKLEKYFSNREGIR